MAVIHAFSNTNADFTGTITGFNSQGSTVTLAATNMVRPSDWNSGHNQLYTLTGNTSNASTASGTNVVLSGGNGITLVGSNSQIGIVAEQHGTFSTWANLQGFMNTQTIKPTQSTFYLFPLRLGEFLSADVIRFASSISIASTSFASTANTTFSYQQAETQEWVLYSRNTGASSMSLAQISSGAENITWSVQMAYGSATNTRQSVDFGLTWFDSAGNAQNFATGYSTSNLSTMALSTGNLTAITGAKFADYPFASSLTPGEYWLGVRHSTTFTTQGTNMSGIRYQNNLLAGSQINNAFGRLGSANSASIQAQLGIGSFTTVGGATTASLGFSNISSSASHPIPMITIGRGLA